MRVDFSTLADLPVPVARYLRHVLADGQPVVRRARLTQAGVLRTNGEQDRWLSFNATHDVSPLAPEFVWDASVRILPFVRLRVRDAYVSGHGSGRVSLFSALVLAKQTASHEMDSGSLHRFLAESVWYPTALLPSKRLQWSPLSDTVAIATLSDGETTVSLEFRFNDTGVVTGIYTPGRWGSFDRQFRLVAWEGRFRDYQRRAGMLVPSAGEVGWYSGRGEWQPVWKGEIINAWYDFGGETHE